MIIIIEFQLYVLAVLRECCVFLVDDMWTSTRGGGDRSHVDAYGQEEGGSKIGFSCGRHKWMTPNAQIS